MDPETTRFAAQTHPGLKRSHNEDCYEADTELGLYLVADGVGGHSCGEVASDIVRTRVRAGVAGGETLLDAIRASHRAVLDEISKRESAEGMGSTVVAALFNNGNYEIAWVGDSRAYLWSSRLRQVSEDHNRAGELLQKKLISPEEAARHPERHVLTQSLGVSEHMALEPGQARGSLAPGEQVLLCSDGLTDELQDGQIERLMSENDSPETQVDALIRAALDAGGNDNVTAIVIGACQPRVAADPVDELETTHDIRHDRLEGANKAGRFPFRALLLISAIATLAIWLLS